MSLDQAERDHVPDGELGESVTSAPSAPRRAYTLFVGDTAAGFDASLLAVHESKMTVGDIVVHAAILDDAHFVRVLVRGRPRFAELFGFATTTGLPTRRIRYAHEHGIDLELLDASGLAVRTRARSSIGRSGGWRGVTHPGDRAHALALAHCLSTNASAPRTVVGVTVDQVDETTSIRIDAVHEYATRIAFNVIACETRLRLTASDDY